MIKYLWPANTLLSSLLLFLIQPLIAKMLLPLHGGGAYVWISTMLFFQAMVLVGYSYSHFIGKYLPLKAQLLLHIAIFALSLLFLPLSIKLISGFENSSDKVISLLVMLTNSIGIITLVLSANSILMQSWQAVSDDRKNPYKLYIASNIGSLFALLIYPIIFEYYFGIKMQTKIWTGIYLLFAATSLCIIFYLIKIKTAAANIESSADVEKPKNKDRLWWFILALVPSSLLFATTTHITTDIGAVPLFWLLPLAVYLISFIIGFSERQPLSEFSEKYLYIAAVVIIAIINFALTFTPFIILHLIFLLLALVSAHSRLYRMRPHKNYLSEFYIFIALGGFVGGVLSALVFPNIFNDVYEYILLIIIVCLLKPKSINENNFRVNISRKFLRDFAIFIGFFLLILIFYKDPQGTKFITNVEKGFFNYSNFISAENYQLPKDKMLYMIFYLIISLAAFIFYNKRAIFIPLIFILFITGLNFRIPSQSRIVLGERNYYGVMKVIDDRVHGVNLLRHGSTLHGLQMHKDPGRLKVFSYYGEPINNIILSLQRDRKNIGVVGLGIGTVACLAERDEVIEFYEIDRDVVNIAADTRYFTYLKDCPSRKKILLGDGRLKLSSAPDEQYDLLIVDVFSSDYIPIHMLTKEAVELYLKKVKKGGVVAVHLSNRYFALVQPFANITNELGKPSAFKFVRKNSGLEVSSLWAVVSNEPENINDLKFRYGWQSMPKSDGNRVWTDDYYNLLSSLGVMN